MDEKIKEKFFFEHNYLFGGIKLINAIVIYTLLKWRFQMVTTARDITWNIYVKRYFKWNRNASEKQMTW